MRVIASDFDNTLYVKDKEIFTKNILAVNNFIGQKRYYTYSSCYFDYSNDDIGSV